MKPRVAVIGTGGTISSMGTGPLDILDYLANGTVLDVNALLARIPEAALVADVVPVPFRAIPSTQLAWPEWKELLGLCHKLAAEDPQLAGIVITHGTASLEETAYFLSLTLKITIPVVLVGAQRPASALSGDGPMNIVNAIRVAADPGARGLGALVLLNDEIQAARDVTKTSTLRMQTFRTADFGVLGHADGDMIAWYRKPIRKIAPDTEFDVRGLDALPRVDIAYCYAGADGAAIDAFVAGLRKLSGKESFNVYRNKTSRKVCLNVSFSFGRNIRFSFTKIGGLICKVSSFGIYPASKITFGNCVRKAVKSADERFVLHT